jgi:uncharacterized protein with LGFP repeats
MGKDKSDKPERKTFKFADRAAQKQRAREEDNRRLKDGEVSPSELRKENAFVKGGGFSAKKIGFSKRYPSDRGDRYYTADGLTDNEYEVKKAAETKKPDSKEGKKDRKNP